MTTILLILVSFRAMLTQETIISRQSVFKEKVASITSVTLICYTVSETRENKMAKRVGRKFAV